MSQKRSPKANLWSWEPKYYMIHSKGMAGASRIWKGKITSVCFWVSCSQIRNFWMEGKQDDGPSGKHVVWRFHDIRASNISWVIVLIKRERHERCIISESRTKQRPLSGRDWVNMSKKLFGYKRCHKRYTKWRKRHWKVTASSLYQTMWRGPFVRMLV